MLRSTFRGISLLVIVLLTLPVFAAGDQYPDGLRPPLGEVLEASAPDELVPVSIVLREQVTQDRIRLARAGLRGEEARKAVLDLLKATARGTQGTLLAEMYRWRGEGRATRIRPLWIGNVIGVDATPDLIRAMAARPEVDWINHNPKVDVSLGLPDPGDADSFGADPGNGPAWSPDGTLAEIECGVDLMGAPQVWNDFGVTGEGAVIAVVDSGVCWTHSDIVNQIWVNPGEDLDGDGEVMDTDDENGVDDDGNGHVDDLIGWDFDQNDNRPSDDNSHGSHCAGTVAGDGTAGTQAGMAPDAKIMVVRVGLNFSDEVSVWNGMQYAAENGADSISMSLGWPHNQNPDRATWRQNCENTIDAGTAMVIAAGNEGQGNEPDNLRTPGDVPRIISVGATDCSDNMASFSSRGPVTWEDVAPFNDHPYPPGLVKPDISAPGVSTRSHNVCNGYSTKSGTSMATPHVAGAVALMVSANPGLTHDEIKQVLEDTALDLGAVGKDNHFGSGRVDAFRAVDAVFGLSLVDVAMVDDDPAHANGDGGSDTGEIVTLVLTVENQWDDQSATNVTGWLTTSTPGVTLVHDYGSWPDVPPLGTADSQAPHFSVRIDDGCNFPIEFGLMLEYNDRASRASFSILVGSPFQHALMADDFESDQGWTVSGTSSTGVFVREDPEEVLDAARNPAQPEDDVTADPGVLAWITGNDDNKIGDDDVDNGTAILTSPAMDASDFVAVTLDYHRWYYAIPATFPSSDHFRSQWSRDGSNWTDIEHLQVDEPEWTAASFTLPPAAFGPGLRIRFMADDDPITALDSVVEVVVDEVYVTGTRIECEPFTPPWADPPNPVGNSLVVDRDGDHVRMDWTAPPSDASHAPATQYRIYRSGDPSGGFSVDGMSLETWHVEAEEMQEPGTWYYVVVSENGGGTSGEAPM